MSADDPLSIFDLPNAEAEEARLEALAEAEIDDGQGVPHDRVMEWLTKLAEGQKEPPPTA